MIYTNKNVTLQSYFCNMAIEKELKIQSIVVLAQSFNPSIFNRHWLIKNEFVEEDFILSNSIFAPGVTQLATKQFNMLVVPEQLQFNIGHSSVDFHMEIEKTLLPIIKKLQEIPYRALGLNFNWFVKDSVKNIKEVSKELFFINESKLFNNFNTDDARFGSYMSMNYRNTRLKLDIKPVSAQDNLTKQISEHIQCSFNFHLDLNPDNCAEELIDAISKWNEFKIESQKIIDLL